jgi:hypothetical protein
MISNLLKAKGTPNAERGFTLSFSDEPFEHDVELDWLCPEEAAGAINQPISSLPATGNRYSGIVAGEKMVAWLCPALYEYFREAPKRIYVRAEKLPEGVDPIWHINSDDPQARRYMSAEFDAP